MSNPQVISALADMADAFPAARVEERTIELYATRLADLDPTAVVAAIDRIINTAKPRYGNYFPSIAEVRESVVAGQPVDGLAELAWTEVQEQVRKAPYSQFRTLRSGVWYDPPKPAFTNAVTEAAVQSMTWKLICHGEDQAGLREQFLWTWKNLASRMVKQAQNGDAVDSIDGASELRLGRGAA